MRRIVYQNPHLDGSTFFNPAGKTGILLIHGFTATTVEVKPLAQFFHNAGFTVAGPLIPGHGTTPQDMNRQKWTDWVNAVEKAYQDLKNQCDRVYVAGESMGGLLTLYLASQHPEISGLLLYAPALIVDRMWQPYLLSPFLKIIYKKGPAVDRPGCLPWQGYHVYPLPALVQLGKLQQQVKKRLHLIHQPTLIFQGLLDTTINPVGSKIIYDSIKSSTKELVWKKESHHCVILDKDLSDVAHQSVAFVNQLEQIRMI